VNSIEPTEEQLRGFAESPDIGPIVMVNLLRYDGERGRARYAEYAAAVMPLIQKNGGRVVYRGDAGPDVIGEDGWDEVILVEYPDRKRFLSILQSEDYQAIAHLRSEGLKDSRLFQTTPTFVRTK
jgi:uncharacterized protein (DUF1330 family)